MSQSVWITFSCVAVVVFFVICRMHCYRKSRVLQSKLCSQKESLKQFAAELRCLKSVIRGSRNLDMQVPAHLQDIDCQAALLSASVEWLRMALPLPTDADQDITVLEDVRQKIDVLWDAYYMCSAVFQTKEVTKRGEVSRLLGNSEEVLTN